jgi:hypothetical protein
MVNDYQRRRVVKMAVSAAAASAEAKRYIPSFA